MSKYHKPNRFGVVVDPIEVQVARQGKFYCVIYLAQFRSGWTCGYDFHRNLGSVGGLPSGPGRGSYRTRDLAMLAALERAVDWFERDLDCYGRTTPKKFLAQLRAKRDELATPKQLEFNLGV